MVAKSVALLRDFSIMDNVYSGVELWFPACIGDSSSYIASSIFV